MDLEWADRQTDRQTNRQTDRMADRPTSRQAEYVSDWEHWRPAKAHCFVQT